MNSTSAQETAHTEMSPPYEAVESRQPQPKENLTTFHKISLHNNDASS